MEPVRTLSGLGSALRSSRVQMEDEVCRSGNFYLPNWQTLNHFCLMAQALVRGR